MSPVLKLGPREDAPLAALGRLAGAGYDVACPRCTAVRVVAADVLADYVGFHVVCHACRLAMTLPDPSPTEGAA